MLSSQKKKENKMCTDAVNKAAVHTVSTGSETEGDAYNGHSKKPGAGKKFAPRGGVKD